MAKKKSIICKDCQIYIKGQQAFHTHLLSKEHQQVLNKKAVNEKRQKYGVHVTGFPSTATPDYFSNIFHAYGNIVEIFIDSSKKFAFIQFDSEESVKVVLATKIVCQGSRLSVNQRVITDKKPLITNDLILEIVSDCQDFDSQIRCLHNKLQLSPQEMDQKYGVLCFDLELCLNKAFPRCKVRAFGSTVTGLSFTQSDVDVFITLARPCSDSKSQEGFIYRAKEFLLQSQTFTDIFAVPKAKTPLVKCVHRRTGIYCDLNFKNMLGVLNTHLIKYFLSVDNRLISLAFIIKCWAKVYDLSGTGRITNYALTMLLIFYLQQQPNPILPSVAEIQLPGYENIQEGWNGGFCTDRSKLPRIQNKLTILQLLGEFFKFYSKFDFAFTVISPFSGSYYSRLDFAYPENLPEMFTRYKDMLSNGESLKINSVMCIQDPIELTHNIAFSTPLQKLELFQECCEEAAHICTETLAASDDDTLLKKLFKMPAPCHKSSIYQKTFTIKMLPGTFCAYGITKIAANTEDKLVALRKLWFDEVHSFLMTVLTKIMLFDVEVANENLLTKSLKSAYQSDVHDTGKLYAYKCICESYINVIHSRKNILKTLNLSPELKSLDREIEISKSIHNLVKDIKPDKPIVKFELIVHAHTDPFEMKMILNNITQINYSFSHIGHFLCTNLQNWYNKYVTELMSSTKSDNIEKTTECSQDLKSDLSDVPTCPQESLKTSVSFGSSEESVNFDSTSFPGSSQESVKSDSTSLPGCSKEFADL